MHDKTHEDMILVLERLLALILQQPRLIITTRIYYEHTLGYVLP